MKNISTLLKLSICGIIVFFIIFFIKTNYVFSDDTLTDTYGIDDNKKIIYGLKNATTVSKIREILSGNSSITVTSNNKTLVDSDTISTGNILTLNGNNYKLSILGDTSGDGKLSKSNAKLVAEHIMKVNTLSNEYWLAADYNQDGKIKMNDVMLIANRENADTYAKRYMVTYNCNEGTGNISSKSLKLNERFTITNSKCTRNGYIQSGWLDQNNTLWTINNSTNWKWTYYHDVVLKPKWAVNETTKSRSGISTCQNQQNTKNSYTFNDYFDNDMISEIFDGAKTEFKCKATINSANPNNKVSRIHFINSGSADAILIESNGKFGLIDTGNPAKDEKTDQSTSANETYTAKNVIKYLDKLGVKYLDFIMQTHAHSDHNGGLYQIAEKYANAKTTFYYRSYEKTSNDVLQIDWDNLGYFCRGWEALRRCGNYFEEVTNRTISFRFGEFNIQILNTEESTDSEKVCIVNGVKDESIKNKENCSGEWLANGENKNSIIQLLTHSSGKKILLSGDMESEDEAVVKNNIGKVDVLKYGHHGATGASTHAYIDVLQPQYGVISHNTTHKYLNIESICRSEILYDTKNYLVGNAQYAIQMTISSSGNFTFNSVYDNEIKTTPSLVFCDTETENDGFAKYTVSKYVASYNQVVEEESYIYRTNTDKAKLKDKSVSYVYVGNKNKNTDWKYVDGKRYYVFSGGYIPVNSFKYTIDGNIYSFDATGAMITGWQKKNDKWYYFDPDTGIMKTGWQKIIFSGEYKWFYLDPNSGVMAENQCLTINNNEYCFNANGVCYSGSGC